jgi:hypothetical protein
VTASGPLAAPFKAKKTSEVPKKVWGLINPFAPVPKSEPVQPTVRAGNPRPWVEMASYGTQSAFADPVNHEPKITLVNVSPTPRP